MARLGEFGAAQKELGGEQDEFGFFGDTYKVVGSIPSMLMLQLAASATGKIDEAEGMAAMWEALRVSLTVPSFKRPANDDEKPDDEGMVEVSEDPAQFNALYKVAVAKRCDIDPLMRLVFALFEAQGGRPTKQASDSSPGPSATSESSSALSTPAEHPGLAHLTPVRDLVVVQTG